MHTVAFIFVVILAIVVLAIFVISLIVKGVFRGIGSIIGGGFASAGGRRLTSPPAAVRRCIDPRCLTENPGQARFCRRCGSSLDARSVRGRTPVFRQAAMW
jgi:hypothetical protein